MQELYERRQAALEHHRKKFEKENGNRHMEHRTDDTAEDEIDCECLSIVASTQPSTPLNRAS